jgi:beta-galactosidase
MKSIQWNDQSYLFDEKPDFLVSGEFHYFRVPREDWRWRLELFRESGGNCVATYVPWILHEPTEGDIRFGDIPERDLEGFLNLCREMELFVICRPGPYQYSELKYDGLPGWLCENYPEIQAVNIKGERFRVSSVSYMHPLFLEKAKKWFDTACPIIARHTLSKGGPVAFVQFDNELMGIHEWFGGWDYNPETMGFGKENGRYAGFLKERYKTMDALNEAYGSDYDSFARVRPELRDAGTAMEERRRVKDYQDFYFSMCAEYAAILTGWFRELGIDCDIVHNSANPGMNAYFLEIVEKMGGNFILGSDHYYNLDMGWEQNNPTPQYASKCFCSNEILRLMGFPATVYEIPGGSCSDWPPITPVDLKSCYLSNIAFGMKGSNYYVFTGGPNPLGLGSNGDSYDYNASIAADGTIRPTYDAQKEYGLFLHQYPWMAAAERVCDFHIGLDWDHLRSKYYFSAEDREEFSNASAWGFARQGIMISSLCASYSPNLLDLADGASLLKHIDKPLFVASSVSMKKEIQENLIGYLKQGGRLLIAPVIPYLDENFHSCTVLMEFLGMGSQPANRKYRESSARLQIGPVQNVHANGTLWTCEAPVIGSKRVAEDASNNVELGWEKEFPGGGKVIWLGFSWSHTKLEHSAAVKYLLEKLGCSSPVVECSNPNLWTSLRSDGKQNMLFVLNLFTSSMGARIRVKQPDGSYYDAGEQTLAPMEIKTIHLAE